MGQRRYARCRISTTGECKGVAIKCLIANGCVVCPGCAIAKGVSAVGSVLATSGVEQKSTITVPVLLLPVIFCQSASAPLAVLL